MAKKRNRKGSAKSVPRRRAGNPEAVEGLEAVVRRHLAAGRSRHALRTAKDLRKQSPGPTSDAIYLEASRARVIALADGGLVGDAVRLLDSVRERFPGALSDLDTLVVGIELRTCRAVSALRILGREEPDSALGRAVCDSLRRDLPDPAVVAECDAVSEDHWARREARAVSRALARVTSEPCDPGALAREIAVPRTSPFAPWKLLILGIEAAYRGDTRALERVESAMPPDARPARLLPVLHVIAGSGSRESLEPAGLRLVGDVLGPGAEIDRDLREVGGSIRAHQGNRLPDGARRALGDLRARSPSHVPDYQRILYREWMASGRDCGPLIVLFDRTEDAERPRCSALAAEALGNPGVALVHWEDFLNHPGTDLTPREIALVRYRQARIAALFEDMPYLEEDCEFDAESSFHYIEKALEAHPSRAAFRLLVEDGRSFDGRVVEEDARRWQEAFPEDVEPVLLLLGEKRRRGAMNMALTLLERAEELDPTHPGVREGRFDLHLERARRRLRNHKGHLAIRDVAELRKTPRAAERPVRALLGTLEWLAASCGAREVDRDACWSGLVADIGDPAARLLLRDALAFVGPNTRFTDLPEGPPPELAAPEAMTALALDEMAMAVTDHVPWSGIAWYPGILEALREGSEPAEEDMEPLCQRARRLGELEILFRLSGLGLRRGGPMRHRFLLHRALALPRFPNNRERRDDCLAAAAEMARRAGDRETQRAVTEALDEGMWSPFDATPFGPAPEEVADIPAVLERETTARPEDVPGLGPRSRRTTRRRQRRRKKRRGVMTLPFIEFFEPDEEARW